MTPETERIIMRYLLSDLRGFVRAIVAATNMSDFRQEQFVKAKALEQRRICKQIEGADIELSAESMATLHEADLPEE